MRVRRYRVWKCRYGPSKMWAVAADWGDGKKRQPFIYAKTLEAAMNRLRKRHENRERLKDKRRRPPMRRPGKGA